METGVAQKPIEDFDAYRTSLKARLNPTTSVLTQVYDAVKANPKRVIFAEAENEIVLRAAIQYRVDLESEAFDQVLAAYAAVVPE